MNSNPDLTIELYSGTGVDGTCVPLSLVETSGKRKSMGSSRQLGSWEQISDIEVDFQTRESGGVPFVQGKACRRSRRMRANTAQATEKRVSSSSRASKDGGRTPYRHGPCSDGLDSSRDGIRRYIS